MGKEIIATCIHHQSTRRDGPFIKVNCGAIVDTLIDSELFGHEKGSFTGSIGLYRGCFECAEGGTILLDEIGELPQKAQVRFLRVLQEKKIKRIGGGEFIPVDVRVIAASNQSLEGLVRRGRFREDLFFRLNVVPIHIPPLRERREDIPELIEYFIKKKSMEMELALVPAPGAVEVKRLMSYHWPGNVRELENIIERALILNKSEWLSFQECDLPLSPPVYQESKSRYDLQPLNTVVHSYIVKILMLTQGQIDGDNGAAKILNINPSTLRHKMKKLGIPFGREWSKEYFHIR